MTFSSEEIRGRFHNLPTQSQFEWSSLEVTLAQTGRSLHIDHITEHSGLLQVFVRIDEKMQKDRAAFDTPT